MRGWHTSGARSLAVALATLVGAVLLVGCGGAEDDLAAPVPTAPAFVYDDSAPLAFEERGPLARGVRDISFRSDEDRIDGYLVLPAKMGRHPAAVYLHGSGGDREQLLDQARRFAARGGIALTMTAPSSYVRPPAGLGAADALSWQRDLAVRDVVATRRAIDVLSSLPNVDGSRIGFVGWSAGGRTGAILAGVESRLDAVVLMSAGAVPVQRYVQASPRDLRFRVRALLGEVDPLRYIARAKADGLLLQDGSRDQVVPRHALVALARRAPRGTEVRWYDAGHSLDAVAYAEQLDWLANRLELDRKPKRWRPSWR
jgi:dienelactone hydrolase